jgi:hypothetical protein
MSRANAQAAHARSGPLWTLEWGPIFTGMAGGRARIAADGSDTYAAERRCPYAAYRQVHFFAILAKSAILENGRYQNLPWRPRRGFRWCGS